MNSYCTTHVLGIGDVELLHAVNGLFADAFGGDRPSALAGPSDEYLERLLAGDAFLAVAALRDGEVVGGLSGYFLPRPDRVRPEFYLYDLAVAESQRRRGIATALIERCKHVAESRGASGIFVQAHPEDEPAVALYRALGRGTEVLHFDIEPVPSHREEAAIPPLQSWMVTPVATVRASREHPDDDCWGGSVAEIVLEPTVPADSLVGLGTFSHVEVVFVFDRVATANVVQGLRRPRSNPAWPEVGIFAQRAKSRPNRVGTTICRLLEVEGRVLRVSELDAIDGTPVIDLKPVIRQFLPREAVLQPAWADELMARYWEIPTAES